MKTVKPVGVTFSNKENNKKGYLKVAEGVVVIGEAILARLNHFTSISYDESDFKLGKDGVTKFFNATGDLAMETSYEDRMEIIKRLGITLKV